MRSSLLTLALSVSTALARPNHGHQRFHEKRLDSVASKMLEHSAILEGTNSLTSGPIRLSGTGDYVVEFTNDSDEENIVLLVWNKEQGGTEYGGLFITSCSWCGGQKPAISVPLAKRTGSRKNSIFVAFDANTSGGWGAAYGDTPATTDVASTGGMLPNTIQEFTFNATGVVDTSLEVYAKGHGIAAQGPTCGTSNTECNFMCNDPAALSCKTDYALHNCAGEGEQGDGTQDGGCTAGPTGSKWTVSFLN